MPRACRASSWGSQTRSALPSEPASSSGAPSRGPRSSWWGSTATASASAVHGERAVDERAGRGERLGTRLGAGGVAQDGGEVGLHAGAVDLQALEQVA